MKVFDIWSVAVGDESLVHFSKCVTSGKENIQMHFEINFEISFSVPDQLEEGATDCRDVAGISGGDLQYGSRHSALSTPPRRMLAS